MVDSVFKYILWFLCSGKDKSLESSNTPSVSNRAVPCQQLEDKGKTREAAKTTSDSNLFTEPKSGIRIV